MSSRRHLLERLWFKYEYLGAIEKDGQVYKKYKKVPRVPHVRRYAFMVWYLLAIILAVIIGRGILHILR
jgi:hypothetical protein